MLLSNVMTLSYFKRTQNTTHNFDFLVIFNYCLTKKIEYLNDLKLANFEETNALNIVFSGIWYFLSFLLSF